MTPTRARTPVRSIFAIILAMLLAVVTGAAIASANDDAESPGNSGQCVGFNTDAKIDTEDFEDGAATWTGVPGNDGNTYTVVGTLSEDGKSISFVVRTEPGGAVVLGATLDFCLKGGSENQGDTTNFTEVAIGTIGRGISNVVVYRVWVPTTPPPEGQWCSPGFWRNSPLQAAAAAENADLSFLPEGVSYVDVLNSPQTFGGDLFNQVGDALSAAAGLEWGDERPENSCPFAADASDKAKPAPVAKGGKK